MEGHPLFVSPHSLNDQQLFFLSPSLKGDDSSACSSPVVVLVVCRRDFLTAS